MIPMPALTFMQSTTHSIQNCGVFHATSTATLALVTKGFTCSFGSHPAGCHPSGGTRTMSAPDSMKREYMAAITSMASEAQVIIPAAWFRRGTGGAGR